MATKVSPEMEQHEFFKALGALLGAGMRHYIVKGAHEDLGHSGTADECSECGVLLRGLDAQGGEIRERLFGSMRDFVDRFGY